MPCSHNCDCGQSVVNGQDGFLAAGQWSKYHKSVALTVKISLIPRPPSSFRLLRASAVNAALLPCL